MKTALYGRIVFGASAALFGVITLMWRDADTWQSLHRILSLPFGSVIGATLMIALIAGGILIVLPRSARAGSTVLLAVFGLFSLACIPAIVRAPAAFLPYDGLAEQVSMLCGAMALYAVRNAGASRAVALGSLARIGLGLCAISFTIAQVLYLRFTASLVPTWIPPNQMFWAILTTVAFGLAAVAMLINARARLAMRLMALMIVLFGVLVWIPMLVAHPESHNDWSEFALNFLIAGATALAADCTR